MRELIHRGRNLLTVVQVLARNSLTPPRTVMEAREVFIDRLHAFARGYELFVDENHLGLTLRQLITAEFKRFPNQCVMDGPEFLLNERSAQTLGLVIRCRGVSLFISGAAGAGPSLKRRLFQAIARLAARAGSNLMRSPLGLRE